MCKVQAFPLLVTSSQMKNASMASRRGNPALSPRKRKEAGILERGREGCVIMKYV